MKNLNTFKQFTNPVNEGFWDSVFGKPTTKDAADSALKSQGYSVRGAKDEDYVMFGGQKFLPDQIEYDSVYSTKPVPRVENGVLIIANPAWKL